MTVPFFITLQEWLPQQQLTRLVGKIAASEKPWLKQLFIDRFIKAYGVNMEEALQMIETAVAAEPQNGAIVDSLGWVLYQRGEYEDAVVHLENSASLLPVDPIINDHLGDGLWAVGRFVEARFQWNRALSFDPTEEDAIRIRRKLEIGLDAVLEQDGEPPLRAKNGDN